MSNKVAVFIGRFQPFHYGHKQVIDTAFKTCDKVIVAIGSSNEPRTARNPFTFEERKRMILDAYPDKCVVVDRVINSLYNDTQWSTQIRNIVDKNTNADDKIYLTGFKKDQSSYYLNMFPEWDSINVNPYKVPTWHTGFAVLDASYIRWCLYNTYHTDWSWCQYLPISSSNVIRGIEGKIIDKIIEEHKFIESYKKQWEVAPYPVLFNTVDAVIVQAGHVLVVHRGAQPGKGLIALPGGFLQEFETTLEGCIRELYEETRIDIPKPVLLGSIRDRHVFDNPFRSQRGRTITHAFYLELDKTKPMPKVKGSDDAEKAFWIPINDLMREYIFEDHACIMEHFIGVRIE